MTTAAEQVAQLEPKVVPFMAAADVPAVPELEGRLKTRAHGNHRNLYTAWLDKPGTVRARIYIGGDVDEHKGEIFVGTAKDITFGELRGADDELAYFEYRNTLGENVFVQLWVPKDAAHDGVKITL